MKMTAKLATTAVATAIALSAVPAGASASFLGGPAFSATAGSAHVFSVPGWSFTCTSSVFNGTVAGSTTAVFTPVYSGCTLKIGATSLAATVAVAGPWNLVQTRYTSPTAAADVVIPAGSSVKVTVLGIPACHIDVAGPQTLSDVARITNVAGATDLSAPGVTGIVYTATSCPGVASGSNLTYTTGALPVNTPGLAVDGASGNPLSPVLPPL